jgi:threonine synthase
VLHPAIKKCVNVSCSLEYDLYNDIYLCSCGWLLDIVYKEKPASNLIHTFFERRNHGGNIYNESGVWRFRDLINFVGIDTEDFESCAHVLVSLDGAEGRLSRPYKMTKAK